ncbi:MAG: FG-GAP-like repeat-containing protein [Acidobacteriota bacterium]
MSQISRLFLRHTKVVCVLMTLAVFVSLITLSNFSARAQSTALTFARTNLQVKGLGPRGITAEDLNGDEIPDLVVANLGTYQLYQSQTLDVFYGKGDGTFTLAQTLPVGDGNQPYGIAAADLRSNERLDIIVPNKDGRTVSVFLQKEDGTFAEPVAYAANDAWSSSVADLNGDTIPDIAVANFDSYAITLLMGVGDGTFFQPTVIPATAGMQPRAVEFGDFNGDGRNDMVVPSDTFDGRVAVFLNKGEKNAASFEPPRIYRVGQLTGFAVVHDIDSDGKLDIITSSAYSNNISALFGNGDGTFTAPRQYGTGDIWPFGIVLTDFDGDGKSDIIATSAKGMTCSVLLGDGRGGFSAPQFFETEGPSRWAAVADFNLDDKVDIAVGNYTFSGNFETDPGRFFNIVSVMLNHSTMQLTHPASFRVNCGGSLVPMGNNLQFAADGNFDGGKVITTDQFINGTTNQALYQSARQGTFTYTAQVAAGRSYTVKLYLAELSQKFSKKRALTIAINGKTILQNSNLLKQAGMLNARPVARRNVWPDSNGQIRIDFSGKKGGAICSGISIF